MAAQGQAAPGFEPLRTAFDASFAEHGELGAAFAVVHDGRVVVDLWDGIADAESGRPWRADTLQLIFSGTKGLTAVCLLLLVDRGRLDLERPVASYWPEFAANGKGTLRVRDVVAHTARLPGVRAPLRAHDLDYPERLAALLAAQPPESDPRARFVYHPLTYGWLCGELVRRVDGRSLGRFFAEEVAGPLDLDVWIGLPATEETRVSRLRYSEDWRAQSLQRAKATAGDELAALVERNPPLFPPAGPDWNSRELHAIEVPATNGIAGARGMARLYGCLARGGELHGVRLLRPETVALGATELSRGTDPLSGGSLAFGVGFQLQTARRRYGPPDDAFGHDGAGGSVHGAWPERRIGFSYVTNDMRWDATATDRRADRLLDALWRVVGGERPETA